ncbi:hypothetical protein, partial [Pseudomonas viridiflava]|uniref:hypothetical protein n=1 Tax=Pseudomonas viridiflava TaxID=33069 RepID=UPI001980AC43
DHHQREVTGGVLAICRGPAAHDDRSYPPRGNASQDAPRPLLNVTQSVTGRGGQMQTSALLLT